MVITYENWGYCCNYDSFYSMQVLLHSDGRIKLQYDNINQNSMQYYGQDYTNATIGIQNAERNDGITYLMPYNYNDPADIFDGLAINV